MGLCSTSGFTFADVCGDAADLPVDHLLVKLLDVEGLHGEGQLPCQHGKHAHTSAHASATKTTFTSGTDRKIRLTWNSDGKKPTFEHSPVLYFPYEGNISARCILRFGIKHLRLYHLHRPDVHLGPVGPVGQQLRGCVGRTSTLGVEELRG